MTRAARVVVAMALTLAAVAVAPAPASATTLVNETFTHSKPDNPNWLVGGMVDTNSVSPCLTAGTDTSQTPIPGCPRNQPSIPAGGDANGQGALRLTSNVGDNTGFVLYQDALPFTAGLDLTFSFYDYNTIPTFVSTGADGVSFFLADGAAHDPRRLRGQPGLRPDHGSVPGRRHPRRLSRCRVRRVWQLRQQ